MLFRSKWSINLKESFCETKHKIYRSLRFCHILKMCGSLCCTCCSSYCSSVFNEFIRLIHTPESMKTITLINHIYRTFNRERNRFLVECVLSLLFDLSSVKSSSFWRKHINITIWLTIMRALCISNTNQLKQTLITMTGNWKYGWKLVSSTDILQIDYLYCIESCQ